MDKPTFVIGDVHGDLPALKALLEQEGILSGPDSTTVIQLGDLGHFGNYPVSSRVNDREIYYWVATHPRVVDFVLWGNHDYAVLHAQHIFGGFEEPFYETLDCMKKLVLKGRMRLAMASHGFLLTHAGLHAKFKHQRVDPEVKASPEGFAEWIHFCSLMQGPPMDFIAIRDAISGRRGGVATAGGILWRDASEKLYGEFRQVFGHSRKDKVRRFQEKSGLSYCIDIHSPTNGRLAGIWLPDERVAEVCIL